MDFRDKWDHWINRFMQKKLLALFFKVIPKDNPRLDLRTYTKIFDHFYTDMKDYDTLKVALQTYPKYLINLEHLLQLISDSIRHDESVAKNDQVLELLFMLNEMNKNYQTAFHILIRMKSKKLFDFMHQVKLDVQLETYLPSLLVTDSKATIDFLMKKYGKYQKTKVLEQCSAILEEMGEDDSPYARPEDPRVKDKDYLMYLILHEIFSRGDMEVS